MKKKIILFYISEHSGHHQASIAIEKAILAKNPECKVLNINAFKFTNPIMEKIIHKAYMGVIKKRPQIWNYLYDNPVVLKKTDRIRKIVNSAASKKIDKLIKQFDPDSIACTQAFPCGVVANYKKQNNSKIPLIGILTDYAPHSFWIYDEVDAYIVPSVEIKNEFIKKGIPLRKIMTLGTPIDPLFTEPLNKESIFKKFGLSQKKPVILIMGGTHGIGPDEKLIKELDGSKKDFQIIVITGVNKKLFKKIKGMEPKLKKKIVLFGFTDNVYELMEISDLIITKPGGLTTAEALAKSLPIIILNPLPGQETLNTNMLLEKGMALKAPDENGAVRLAEELIDDPDRIRKMREAMKADSKPHSTSHIADFLLKISPRRIPAF